MAIRQISQPRRVRGAVDWLAAIACLVRSWSPFCVFGYLACLEVGHPGDTLVSGKNRKNTKTGRKNTKHEQHVIVPVLDKDQH
jgi:hypothetical protein